MEQAREELGADALLLNSREAPPEARHLGDYEVVFGACAGDSCFGAAAPAPSAAVSRTEELYHRIHEIRRIIGQQVASRQPFRRRSGRGARALIEAGVETDLARESIERGARRRLTRRTVLDIARPCATTGQEPLSWLAADRRRTRQPLRSAARNRPRHRSGGASRIRQNHHAGQTRRHAVPQAGPCGAARSPPTRCASAPPSSCAPTPRFSACRSRRWKAPLALAQAIDSAPANTWLLIDTPGYSAAMQQELGGDLAAFLGRRQDIDTHLVLTASMGRDDLRNVTDRFRCVRPRQIALYQAG